MGENFELIMTLVSIGIISVFGYLIINMVLNLTAVEVTEKATLIGKDTENASHMNGDSMATTTTYVLTFEVDGGERITFRVGRGVYRKYVIGELWAADVQKKMVQTIRTDLRGLHRGIPVPTKADFAEEQQS